jgi:hypothetical protein
VADRSTEVSVDVNGPTIGIASTSFSPVIAARAFDRPVGAADILHHKFRFMSKQAEDRTVSEIPIFLFEQGKLMSDAPHSLGRRM